MEWSYRVAWILAGAVAQHFKIDNETLVDTHWVYLEDLIPLFSVLGAAGHLDFNGETDFGSDLEPIALVGLLQGSRGKAARVVGNLNGTSGVVFNFNR